MERRITIGAPGKKAMEKVIEEEKKYLQENEKVLDFLEELV